jgi:hypothetical protein
MGGVSTHLLFALIYSIGKPSCWSSRCWLLQALPVISYFLIGRGPILLQVVMIVESEWVQQAVAIVGSGIGFSWALYLRVGANRCNGNRSYLYTGLKPFAIYMSNRSLYTQDLIGCLSGCLRPRGLGEEQRTAQLRLVAKAKTARQILSS